MYILHLVAHKGRGHLNKIEICQFVKHGLGGDGSADYWIIYTEHNEIHTLQNSSNCTLDIPAVSIRRMNSRQCIQLVSIQFWPYGRFVLGCHHYSKNSFYDCIGKNLSCDTHIYIYSFSFQIFIVSNVNEDSKQKGVSPIM